VSVRPTLTLDDPATKHDVRERLLWERELLGLYLSQHPLEIFEAYLEEQTVPINSLKPEHDGKAVIVGGSVVDVREITTKNGKKMAFVKIEDRFGETEAILFPNSYQQTHGTWERDKIVLIHGKVSGKNREGTLGEEVKILVDDAREITTAQAQQYEATGKKRKVPKASKTVPMKVASRKAEQEKAPPKLYVRLGSSQDTNALMSLKQAIDDHRGETVLVIVFGEAYERQVIKLPVGIDTAGEGVTKLAELVGADNVRIS
jgi:DNA polymerase-3 subunit alpha